MKTITGISASPGIALGEAYVYVEPHASIPKYTIDEGEIAGEMDRLTSASERAVEEIDRIRADREGKEHDDHIALLDSHRLMLLDDELHARIEGNLRDHLLNVEYVVKITVDEYIERLERSRDEYLRSRAVDLNDVSKRLVSQLLFRERVNLADLTSEIVLVAHDLMPSDAIAMNKRMVRGIVLDEGGKTSHTAILARAFEIPAVVGLSDAVRHIRSGTQIIVDGNEGRIVIDPDEGARSRYLNAQREWRRHEVQLMVLNELPAETADGKLLRLEANIEVPEEVEAVLSHGADGIGLYRSEFLFLRSLGAPSEDEQYEAYRHVLEAMADRPVTIRTIDVGGDKVVPTLQGFTEKNPILGWRAIRFCLSHRDVFRVQLRALLRASVVGNLRIMFPMISGIGELSSAIEIVEEVKADLRQEGVAFDEHVPVGTMIEVPSAALTADHIARRSDFFSIGTNDLIQYTIAVDRGNENIAYLYEPFHPAVLRLIKTVIDSAHDRSISVGMCGEMAGDPLATMILLGLGLDEFSMSSFGIPEVKRIIRSVSLSECEEIAGQALDMRSAREVDSYARSIMEKRLAPGTHT